PYAPFASPGSAPLARLGLDVEIAPHVRRPSVPFCCIAAFDPRVVPVPVLPGFDPEWLARFLDERGPRAILLQAFGVGNVPVRVKPIAPVVRRAVERGVTVLVVSQSRHG